MLKCKHNEDCSHYPLCEQMCGLSLQELLWRKNQEIRDLKHQMISVRKDQLLLIEKVVHTARKRLEPERYEPTCPYGYEDCISDPAYIREYHPKWWEELGMPTECSQAKSWEAGGCCCYYDDEDK